jgi:transcriptional regulator with XRE-family HTH domain
MNEILRRAILRAGLDEVDVAASLEVDPKTVRRWLEGRIPYARHRWALADALNLSETDLWPELRPKAPRPVQLLGIYSRRSAVPRETWRTLFSSAQREVSILDYSSLFLAEDSEILRILTEKATSGVHVRIALGDPRNPRITKNGAEIADICDALTLYESLIQLNGVEIRFHHVALYNSIFHADNELLCSQRVYGIPDAHNPVLHLECRHAGDLGCSYLESLERIWGIAKPLPVNWVDNPICQRK